MKQRVYEDIANDSLLLVKQIFSFPFLVESEQVTLTTFIAE